MATGGRGCISVTANVAPRLCADFQAACLAGDYAGALTVQDKLFPLHNAMFTDASPGPVKYAMTKVRPGFPETPRLPMTRSEEHTSELQSIMRISYAVLRLKKKKKKE